MPAPSDAASAEQIASSPVQAKPTEAEDAASEEHQSSRQALEHAQATEPEGAASEEHHSSRPALEKAQATAEGGAVEHLEQRSSDIPLRQRYMKMQVEREQRAARIQASSQSLTFSACAFVSFILPHC